MGLALIDPSSFNRRAGAFPPGSTAESEADPDSTGSEPPCWSHNSSYHRVSRTTQQQAPRRDCDRRDICRGTPSSSNNRSHPPPSPIRGTHHHAKPRRGVADADANEEGAALPWSSATSPCHYCAHDGGSVRRRPPSLERQDAFRDARTVKRRRRGAGVPTAPAAPPTAGASIVCEEPVYPALVRPAGRGRNVERESASFRVGLDWASSVFAEDETPARFLLPGPGSASAPRREPEPAVRSWTTTTTTTRTISPLTVIYELAGDGATPKAAECGDFLDSLSMVSGWTVDDEFAWPIVDGYTNVGNDNAAVLVAATTGKEEEQGGSKPWVVLGLDGS
ncbi:hypothetical protein VTK26DRAFT_4062 [Humicola hyalothermophila]